MHKAMRVMTSPIRTMKNRYMAWLLREFQKVQALKQRNVVAVLDNTAEIAPEGEVENLAGDPSRVIVGAHSLVRGRLLTYAHGGSIRIGEWCYVGVRSEIWSMNAITVGDRVLISHDVNIHDGTAHSTDPLQRHAHYRTIMEKGHPRDSGDLHGIKSEPVTIGNDVWVSFGVTILKGVNIGAGSIVAAGAMVTKDIPPGTLYRCEPNPVLVPIVGSQDG